MLRLAMTLTAAAGVLALAAAAAYQGTFRGTTGQGLPISFVVNSDDRVVALNLKYELPGCEVKQQIKTTTPIRSSSFTFSLNTPGNTVSVRGRFSSASQASGTLIASGDCGRVSTSWRAARGAPTPSTPTKPTPKPEPKPGPFEGLWEGTATFPAGLDQELRDELDPMLLFEVFGSRIETADFPFLIRGAGCAAGGYVERDLRPPVTFKGKTFALSLTTKAGVKIVLSGTFDSAKRAHGTLTARGTFEGCTGEARLTWRASNVG